MNKTQVVTLRMPLHLKRRLKREANYQGVSLNQLTNYLLNMQLTQIESISVLEDRLSKKSEKKLKARVKKILEKVPDNPPLPYDNLS